VLAAPRRLLAGAVTEVRHAVIRLVPP